MLHFRLAVSVVALLIASLAAPAPVGAQDKEKICRDIENRPMTVGHWATYTWTGGQSDGSTMRFAVVGKEPQQGTTYYWYELILDNPKRGAAARVVMQMLVPGLGYRAGGVRAIITKSGNQPAMRMPEQMVRMMASGMGANVAAEIAQGCKEMDVVGWEEVTVPAGHFRALHLRHARDGIEAWVQPTLNFAMVKAAMKDGGTMVLTAQGTGAKSSITETPREMTGFPGGQPPR